MHAARILRRDGGDGGHGVPAQQGDCLDIGLNARATAGIRSGDDEDTALGTVWRCHIG